MDRRSGDEVQRKIGELEQQRDRLGSKASLTIRRQLDSEIGRLRCEQHRQDRPFIGGRRWSDPKPGWG